MKTKLPKLGALIAVTVFALPALSLDYDESIQGDIHQHGNNGSFPLFSLDPGLNVIQGSDSYSTPFNFDLDQFRIRVPQGMVLQLESAKFEYTITHMFGEVVALGTSIGIGTGTPKKDPEILWSTGDTHGPNFFMFSDLSIEEATVSPSPVSLQFFQVVNSAVDVTRPVVSLPAGNYWVLPGLGWWGIDEHGASWNYKITFTVSPAP